MSRVIDKKTKVILTALNLYVEKGFDRVSTAEISKVSGIATGTIFHYFSSKEQIIRSAYILSKHQIIAQTVIKNPDDTIEEQFSEMYDNLIQWGLENQNYFNYLQYFMHSPYYSDGLMDEDDTWKSLLRWWEEAIEAGAIKAISLELLLNTFTSILFCSITFLIHHQENRSVYKAQSRKLCWDSVKADK
jgi:AcrR family transcriptional regulator